jgi:prolyl oligopeptidase
MTVFPQRTLLFVTLLAGLLACSSPDPRSPERPAYPDSPRMDVVDDYHGTKVADPYRWLENPDAAETRAWIAAQNRTTRAFLDAIPERPAIRKRLEELWNYERWTVPVRKAGRLLYTHNDGLQNQNVLWVAASPDAEPRVLLDPNTLSKDGTVALGDTAVSEDGKLLAYELSEAGSDWTTVRVRDVDTGRDLPDSIEWVKFSQSSWTKDGQGFFYSTYPVHDTTGTVALKDHRLHFHRLGTKAAEDRVVYARPDHPDWGFAGKVTSDGEMLVVTVWQGTDRKNRVYLQDLRDPSSEVLPFLDDFDAQYVFLAKLGSKLLFRTDLDAARGRVIAIDVAHPARAAWRTVVPESPDTLESAWVAGGRLVCAYLKDAANELRVFDLDGGSGTKVALPGLGSVSEIRGEPDDPEVFFSYSSFTSPASIWRLEVASAKAAPFRSPKVRFDPAAFVTEQVFVASRDGTRLPMFVTRRKDVHPGPATPALVYGYGGFDIPMKPEFSPANLVWMERGGIYAVPCLRGGGEYGREWHESGTKERKQNVFDDCIAAAESLVERGMTSKRKLALRGHSNGGLLVGACLTQRPDLFGAALPGVGVLDMLRYHRFTIGWAWASDYGTSDDPAAFEYLRRYSPLHNVKEGVAYPPTLITTADHDDRVVPAHSFKFAAALQHAQAGKSPILIRIETRAGHGAGKPTSMRLDEVADEWAFLADSLR